MKNRRLRVETLEERALLAVVAGGTEEVVSSPESTGATTWIVNTTDDPITWDSSDDVLSLREAIAQSSTGDIVIFDDSLAGGTVTLNGSQLEIINKGISVDATSIGGITIDGAGKNRVFYITGGDATNPVELVSLTITGGKNERNITLGGAGGVYNYSGNLRILSSIISGNSCSSPGSPTGYGADPDAGGISNAGTLTIINSTISGNTGAGLLNCGTKCMMTITQTTITGNSGDGVYSYNGKGLTIEDSIISANSGKGIRNDGGNRTTIADTMISKNSGGGISNSTKLEITNSTISGNCATAGGGIYNTGTLIVDHSIISGNSCSGTHNPRGGGGIRNSGTATVSNSTISGNFSNTLGGGICNMSGYDQYDPKLTVINSTISGNSASEKYGGIYIDSYKPQIIQNSIITFNYASEQPNISNSDRYSTNDNIIGTDPGFIVVPSFDGTGKLLNFDKLDFGLKKTSPAIDSGTNDFVDTETDLAGNSRIVNEIVDIGAYEYQGELPGLLTTPTITAGNKGFYVSYGANRHQIIWDAIDNASGYELEYSNDGSSWTTVLITDPIAVVTGLTYGQDVRYRVRALGTGSYTDSEWSPVKTFVVCPMDIDGDGDISPGDRVLMTGAWLSGEGDDEFLYAADINGDGDVSSGDRVFLSLNWLLNVDDDAYNLIYPRPLAADMVFAEFISFDIGVELDVF